MNKKGFTFIEVMIGTVMLFVVGVSSLGFYNNYTNQLDDTTQYVQMKVNATRNYGLSMSDLLYTINGEKSRPYIKFDKNKMTVLSGQGQNLEASIIPYSQIHDKLVSVTTTVNGNTIYFNDNGLAVDKSGKSLQRVHIYVNKQVGSIVQTETITIDCLGNISTVKMKDISSIACTASAPVEDPIAKKNRQTCPSGFSYNASIGSCEVVCNKTGYEVQNGNCAKKCPAHAGHKYEKLDVCVCDDGYEPWSGQCLVKCKENEIRNNNGVCVNSSNAFPAGEIVDVTNLPKNLKAIKFKIWGAGGGYGGNDSAHGGDGAGGGYVEGEISAVYTDKIQILIGSSGNNGLSAVNSGAGASPGKYGGGGAGGGTGHIGSSGSGGSGGGASWLAINGTYVAVAGGGGGGGGGSNQIIGLNAGTCFTVAQNVSQLQGGTCPSDGGGGGGGGGSEPFGGIGGRNGYDYNYGDAHSAVGGCNGMNKLSPNVRSGISYGSSNYLPANPNSPVRNGAGEGGQNSGAIPATNGLVILTYVTGELGNEV